MTMHIFNVDDAVEHGVEKAVILQNMRFWLDKNKANGTNLHDGYYWTYNSAEAFFKLFPYLKSAKIIQRLLKSMVAEGLLLAGNYNKKGYDRTKWYSMPEYCAESLDTSHCSKMTIALDKNDQCNGQKCPMDCSEMSNALVKNDQPIPDVNTDSNPDVNTNVNTDIGAKKKPSKKTVKKLTDYPNDFKPTENQVAKMNEYGINIPLFLDTFESGTKAKGIQYKCWTSAFTTWINNEIKFRKLVPVSEKPFSIDDEDWNNPNAPARYQQPDAYHPSHQIDRPMIDTRPTAPVVDNWHWKEPLPGMSVAQTTEYLKANKRKGENTNKAYQRLLVELQEGV
ncbi:hypothetical protein [Psychrobacter sp. 1044]|uniref:hypothetical protein n=1 Tax=Psychrobacter sp. 1044 TaxID=2772562 RepID=UPI001919C33B|nr:hypothetical protein [Psychrobacter sp. 1044]